MGSVAAGPGVARARGPTRTEVALLALATAVAVAGAALVLRDGNLQHSTAFAAMGAWTVVGFVAAGVYWRRRRPANPLGAVLIVLGALAAGQIPQGFSQSLPFSLGVLFDAPVVLLAWYALLAFPSGRLDRAGRLLMAGALGLALLVFLPWILVSPSIEGGSPLAVCARACPRNALMVVDGGRAADVLEGIGLAWRLAIGVAITVALILRLAGASTPRRRALGPVTVVAALWTTAFCVYGLGVKELGASGLAESVLALGVVVPRMLLPVAFLLAPLQARAFAGSALEEMVERLGARASVAEREWVIARALDDPSLRLGFWLPGAGRYVDGWGRTLEPPRPDSGRVWTPAGNGDPPEAAIVHDAALADEPELLRAAGRTLLLALENGRLHDELEHAMDELTLSRRRLVAAGTTERRRFERELHDGTQQQLVALRVRLALAVDRAEDDPALARVLVQLGSDLEAALADVRRIAGALYPPILADEGLPAAVVAAVRHAGGSPRRVEAVGVGRHPDEVEAAVYFCIEEAIGVAAASPGGAGSLRVRLSERAGVLRVELRWEGEARSFPEGSGAGMSAMLGAVGGGVEIGPGPEGGTMVSASVPASAPVPLGG